MNNLATPWGFLYLELRRRFDRARSAPDLGASAIEWVIITGVLVAIAAAVGFIIFRFVNDSANNLEVPDLPDGGGGVGGA